MSGARGAGGASLVALVVAAGCASLVGLDDLSYDEQPTGGAGAASAGGQGATAGSPPVGGGGSGNTGGVGAGGVGGVGGTGGVGGIGGAGGCSDRGDEFDDPGDLDCWNEGPLQTGATAIVENGHLSVTATANDGWYNSLQGWFIYRTISGNFAVETQITVSGLTDPPNPPTEIFNAAGLMARNGTTTENWVLFDVGHQDAADGLGTVYKNTSNGTSSVNFGGSSAMSGRLLLCRVGNDYYMFRNFGGGWSLNAGPLTNAQLTQPDLQVGLVVSSWTAGPPDVHAEFDYVRFARTAPSSMADCTAEF